MSTIKNLNKKVVTIKEFKYEWKSFSYAAIAKSDAYKEVSIKAKDGTLYQLPEALDLHTHWAAKRPEVAKRIKVLIDEALDAASRQRVKDFYHSPAIKKYWAEIFDKIEYEAAIQRLNETLPVEASDEERLGFLASFGNPNKVVVWQKHIPQAYNGEVQDVSINEYKEDALTYYDNLGVVSNSAQRYDNTLHGADKKTYTVIRLAKVFGITPAWEETTVDGALVLGLTQHAFKELQQQVNWFTAMADTGTDLSDVITLHHTNGVDTLELTEYEYFKHLADVNTRDEFIETYQRTERRDFLAPLHEADEE